MVAWTQTECFDVNEQNLIYIKLFCLNWNNIPYGRKRLREKTIVNSWFCDYLQNLGAWHPLVQQKRAIHESFLRKNCIFRQFVNVFSLKSFPLYGTGIYTRTVSATTHSFLRSLRPHVVLIINLIPRLSFLAEGRLIPRPWGQRTFIM